MEIVSQTTFDGLVNVIRVFDELPSTWQEALWDGLASSLICLAGQADRLAASQSTEADLFLACRNALRVHLFFLSWLVSRVLRSPDAGAGAASTARGAAGVKRTVDGSAPAGPAAAPAALQKAVKAAAACATTDLWAVFRPASPDDAFLLLLAKTVQSSWGGWL